VVARKERMKPLQVVIDTNVIVSALRSSRGASYKLLWLLGGDKFEIHLSVPLFLEYEAVAKRLIGEFALTAGQIDDILDYICSLANYQRIFYLWRPFLKDAQDEMVLELAVTAGCEYIITYNETDFEGVERFGLQVRTPQEFLEEIGELR
jgi:putative PIN family toxin of toxin-antitoxin system